MKPKSLLIALLACLIVPVNAHAASFTLDGKSASAAQVAHSTGGCAMFPNANDVTECFSSAPVRDARVRDALTAGLVPPGFAGLPSASDKQAFLGAGIARSKKTKPIAHASGCGTGNHAYSSYYLSGTYWWSYDTSGIWKNLPSGSGQPANKISSDQTSNTWHTYYADGYSGGPPQFTKTYNYCHLDNDLRLDARPGGGTWDGKFSSIYSG